MQFIAKIVIKQTYDDFFYVVPKKDNVIRSITDIALLKSISKYLANVIGNLASIKSISDYITTNNRKVSPHTVNDYVDALIDTFMFYPVDRYNIQGKEELKTNKKYYIVV